MLRKSADYYCKKRVWLKRVWQSLKLHLPMCLMPGSYSPVYLVRVYPFQCRHATH